MVGKKEEFTLLLEACSARMQEGGGARARGTHVVLYHVSPLYLKFKASLECQQQHARTTPSDKLSSYPTYIADS